jgi:hypothetical protein
MIPLRTGLRHRNLHVNRSHECVYIAIFITKVKIRTLGYCTIFRRNKHSEAKTWQFFFISRLLNLDNDNVESAKRITLKLM